MKRPRGNIDQNGPVLRACEVILPIQHPETRRVAADGSLDGRRFHFGRTFLRLRGEGASRAQGRSARHEQTAIKGDVLFGGHAMYS